MASPNSTPNAEWNEFVLLVGKTSDTVRGWSLEALNEELEAQGWKGMKKGEVQAHWKALQPVPPPNLTGFHGNTGSATGNSQEYAYVKAAMSTTELHFSQQAALRKKLLDIYTASPFHPTLEYLPDLQSYPKAMPLIHNTKFLLRETPKRIFQKLEYWDKIRDTRQCGMYLAGPNGVGKSIAIYTLVCLAQAHGWIVLYVPNCDEWVVKVSEVQAMEYLLSKFALALAPFYAQPTLHRQHGATWGELLLDGLAGHNSQQALSNLLDELCSQEVFPLLLVFDEVNALFTEKLTWNRMELAKSGPYFNNLAASINKLTMRRGWKVISGTGHEQFLEGLPSGLTDTVRYLTPFEQEEFYLLLKSDICHPWLHRILAIANIAELVKTKLSTATGRVPRQLYEFSRFIHNTVGQDDAPPSVELCDEFFKKQFPDKKDPITRLHYLLDLFLKKMAEVFKTLHISYYMHLDAIFQPAFIKMCVDVLTYSNSTFATPQYLDKNLIYWEPKVDRYVPLTPASSTAILSHLRANRGIIENNDDRYNIINAHNRDEASRPFERYFHKALLLLDEFTLTTTRLDNTDLVQEMIKCNFSCPILPPSPDLTKEGRLFKESVGPSTLLAPIVFNYPVMDFALIGEQTVYIFQLTLGRQSEKLPVPGSSYYALHNHQRWEEISKINSADPKYITYAHKNFMECLLNSVLNIRDSVVELQGRDVNIVHPNGWHVVYVIVSARRPTLPEPKEIQESAKKFPWVRILTFQCLESLLGAALANTLADLCLL